MSALLKRIARNSLPIQVRIAIASKLGKTNWYRLGDGITFREEGFVAADSPASLLARHHYEVQAIHRALSGVKAQTALEIGCGYGRLSPTIAQHARKLISIDHNAEIVKRAQLYYPNIDYRVASVDTLPFADSSFDAVVSWTVLQHVPPRRIAVAASEVQRVLNPGGVLLLCEETRHVDVKPHSETHTWHRSVGDYQNLFAELELDHHEMIPELERLEAIGSPGRVMTFRKGSRDNSRDD